MLFVPCRTDFFRLTESVATFCLAVFSNSFFSVSYASDAEDESKKEPPTIEVAFKEDLDPDKPEADRSQRRALDYAEIFIQSVEDEDFQSQHRLTIVDHLVGKQLDLIKQTNEAKPAKSEAVDSAGAPLLALERAETVARAIADYRRGIGLSRVAIGYALAGNLAKAKTLLEDPAIAMAPRVLSWQDDLISAEMVIAWAAVAEDERADAALSKIKDNAARTRARAGVAVERLRRKVESADRDLEDALSGEEQDGKLRAERVEYVRALVRMAEITLARAGDAGEEARKFAERAREIIPKYQIVAGDDYYELGFLWRKLDDAKKASEVLDAAIRQMPPGLEMQSWRPGTFARLASAYHAAGQADLVEKMIETCRANIEKSHVFYRPLAWSQVAEAHYALGEIQKATKAWQRGIAAARSNPNPSSTYLGCAQVALSIARAIPDPAEIDVPLPDSLESDIQPALPRAPASQTVLPPQERRTL
jgi:tetratricopeptide (TPR) repeat protein